MRFVWVFLLVRRKKIISIVKRGKNACTRSRIRIVNMDFANWLFANSKYWLKHKLCILLWHGLRTPYEAFFLIEIQNFWAWADKLGRYFLNSWSFWVFSRKFFLIYFSFNGLFAPHWRSDARGTIVGLTQYTRREHICRATLEAVAFQGFMD